MNNSKCFRRLISLFLSFALLFQSFAPAVLAVDELITPEPTEVVGVVPTETPTPTEASAPTPEVTPEPTIEPTPEITPEPTMETAPTPTETPTPEVAVEPTTTPTEEPTPVPTPKPLWVEVGGDSFTTSENVGEGIDYRFRDTNLVVRFTKLTKPGKLTIKQVKLTPEQIAATGAVSDTAYDITSDMTNGSFLYDLTLPLPEQTSNPEVKFAASADSLTESQDVSPIEDVKADSITIRGLDHFTIFFISGGVDQATHGDVCVLYDCTLDADHPSLRSADSQYLDISSFDASTSALWPNSEEPIPEGDNYVQFDFSPGLVPNTLVSKAHLEFVYKTNEIDTSDSENKPYGAKLVISSEDFGEDVLFIKDVTPDSTNSGDLSFDIDLLPEFQNSNDLNNLQARFYLYGTAAIDPGVTTSFNQVALIVPPPAPTLVFPSDGALVKATDAVLDWTDVTDILGEPVTYYYRSSWAGGSYPADYSTGVSRSISQIDARGSASRTYNWQVRACAGLGTDNCSDWSGPWTVTIDATAPTTPGTPSSLPNPTNSSLQTWDWTTSSDANGINGYWYSVSGPVSLPWMSLGNVLSTSTDFALDGLYQFSVKAEDNAGNLGASSSGILTVDTIPPATPSVIGWTSENPPVGSDYVSGTDFTNFRTCGGSLNYSPMTNLWSPSEGSSGYDREVYSPENTLIYSHSVSSNYVNGGGAVNGNTYYVRIRAYDQAGNRSAWSSKCGIRYDTSAPTATFNYSTTALTNGNVIATLVGSEPVTVTNNGGSDNYTFTANGTFTFEFIDAAGNTSSAIATVGNIDTNPPASPTHLSPPDGTFTTTSGLTMIDWSNVSDPEENGPVTYRYQSSLSSAINLDGSFAAPIYSSGVLSISQINTPGTPAGVYYWHVRAVDGLGNLGPWSSAWKVTVDNTAPSAPASLQSSPNPTKSTTQSWTWDPALDGGSGVKGYWYRINGDTVVPTTFIGDVLGWNTSLLQGNYSFYVKAEDNSGNKSSESNSSLTVDTTKPTDGSLSINDGALYTSNTIVDLSISATDNLTDVSQMKIKNADGSYTDWLTYATEYFNWELADEDGKKEVRVRFMDGAGNENPQYIASDIIILDHQEPGSSAQSPEYFSGENIPVSFTADDANGEVDTSGVSETALWYRFNGGEWIDSGLTLSGTSGNFDFFPEEGEGTYEFYTIATDNVGNQEPENYGEDDESVSPDSTTIFDTTKPESFITSPSNEGTNTIIYSNAWDGSIAGTATDNDGSGLARVDLSIQRSSDSQYWNGEGWVDLDEEETEPRVTADGTESWSYLLTEPGEDAYEIISHAVDNADNTENSYKLTIIFDKTIPEVSLTIDPADPDSGNGWYKTDPIITLTATDANNDHIEYQWDSQTGTWNIYGSPFKIPSEGDHILYYQAFDRAGNVSDTGIKNIKYDKTDLTDGPKNVSVSPNPTSGTKAKVTWEAATDNVGVEKYEVNWSLDGTSTSYTDTVGNEVREHDINKLDQEGKWNVTVTAFDYAGNKKSGSTELTVDRGAPAAPTLRLDGTGTGEATLGWNLVSDANDYIIWYGNVPGTYLFGARVGNVNSFTVRGLGGGDYYFVIKSVDSAGNQSGYSNEVNTLRLVGAPGIAPETPAEGFSPEVQGASTQATPTETLTPTPEVLGETESDTNSPWWLMLLLLGSGGLTVWFFFRRD